MILQTQSVWVYMLECSPSQRKRRSHKKHEVCWQKSRSSILRPKSRFSKGPCKLEVVKKKIQYTLLDPKTNPHPTGNKLSTISNKTVNNQGIREFDIMNTKGRLLKDSWAFTVWLVFETCPCPHFQWKCLQQETN